MDRSARPIRLGAIMKRAPWILGVLATVALLVLGLASREPEPDEWMANATTYSRGPRGSKALFLFLSQLGLESERLRNPAYGDLQADTVLWILAREPLGLIERRNILRFIEKGGTLVAPPQSLIDLLKESSPGSLILGKQSKGLATAWGMDLDLDDTPVAIVGLVAPLEPYATTRSGTPVVAAWGIGAGRAVSLGVDEIVRNDRIGRAGNGLFLARLALALGKRHVFDEYQSGFGEADFGGLLARVPYRWGILQLALIGVIGIVSLVRRRFPAEPSTPLRRRRTLDHVEAVARLWEQSGDGGLALQSIMIRAAERAQTRLGGGGETPFVEWVARVRPNLAPRARETWSQAERLCQKERPLFEDVRRVAGDIMTLEREATAW